MISSASFVYQPLLFVHDVDENLVVISKTESDTPQRPPGPHNGGNAQEKRSPLLLATDARRSSSGSVELQKLIAERLYPSETRIACALESFRTPGHLRTVSSHEVLLYSRAVAIDVCQSSLLSQYNFTASVGSLSVSSAFRTLLFCQKLHS